MTKKVTLAEARRRLDDILKIMSDSDLPFDKLLDYYQEASELLSFSYKEINKNKGKFEELREKLEKTRSEELKND